MDEITISYSTVSSSKTKPIYKNYFHNNTRKTDCEPSQPHEPVAVITLRPTKTEPRKKVVWTEDTVDNEHMNKKKSKCCCIYEKPRRFDESDSEDSDDECEHCFGHVEKKHGHTHTHTHSEPGTSTATEDQDATAAEATATVLLRTGEPLAPPEPPIPPS